MPSGRVEGSRRATFVMERSLDRLTTEEGRATLRFAISRIVNRRVYRFGFALLSDHFYQPLPRRAHLLTHRQPCRSIDRTIHDQAEFVRDILIRYGDDLAAYLGSFGYSVANSQLPAVDASMLYAVIRHAKPRRVVEVGSGSSTQVIAAALERNAVTDGQACTFTSIDPYVVPTIQGLLDRQVRFEHRMEPLQDVDSDVWESIAPGDILFIDSSHVFKAGSDVEHQFTQIYPSLATNVLLHIHDVFLPNDYPLEWNLHRSQFWNEQQYLAVMLENSDRYEVVAGLAALFDHDRSFFQDLVMGFDGSYSPGSIWLRTTTPRQEGPVRAS